MSSSLAQLSAAFSVLLAVNTHFTLAFFSTASIHNELLSPDNFGSGWESSSLLKINKRGEVAIIMSWGAFFEKINSRGGRLLRIEEYACIVSIMELSCNDQFVSYKGIGLHIELMICNN